MKPNDLLLDRLENSIKKLRLEYEVFFNGGSERVPDQFHNEVSAEVKRLLNLQSLTYAQRFRLNTLATTFNVYNELWQRNIRELEQGEIKTYGVDRQNPTARRTELAVGSENDDDSIDVLLQAFSRARDLVGNDDPIDPLRFQQFVKTKLREMKSKKSCSAVVFAVMIEEGEVHLKARARQ